MSVSIFFCERVIAQLNCLNINSEILRSLLHSNALSPL